MTSSRNADKFVVRLPDGLRERIAEAAKRDGRSMNSQIVSLLDAFYGLSASENSTMVAEAFQPPWQPVVGQLVRIWANGDELPGVYVLEGIAVKRGEGGGQVLVAHVSDESGAYTYEEFESLRPVALQIGEGIPTGRRGV